MRTLILALLLCAGHCSFAQKESLPKFGKVDPQIFSQKTYSIDSSAPAVVLLDIGKSEIIGNRKGWFSLRFTHRKRVHILNKAGYDHASFVVSLMKSPDREIDLESLKCYTYNLEGGKVTETKLEKSQIFEEQVDKHRTRIRCTAPAVKEGSVVEYEYTIISDSYFTLMPWAFQGSIPCLWSEYQFSLPQFMDFLTFSQGYMPFHIREHKDQMHFFSVTAGAIQTRTTNFNSNVTHYRWVMKDVPVLKEERYTSTLDNHVARIEFQLAGYKDPLDIRSIMSTWPETVKELMDRDDFGRLVNANNGWLDEYWKPLVQGASTDEEKVRRIYNWVQENYVCTDKDAILASKSLRSIVKEGKGSVSDINLLLVALLRNAGFYANPVLLSTRDNGYTNAIYPLINKYNYVLAQVEAGGRSFLLDASSPYMGFAKLPYYCYNGTARIFNQDATPVDLLADSLMEKDLSILNVYNIGEKWMGQLKEIPGYYESADVREEVKEKGKEELLKDKQEEMGSSVKVIGISVDSLKLLDLPIAVNTEFDWQLADEDLLYVNPIVANRFSENPFKAATRLYPVEMPYAVDRQYIATIHVPAGYEIDEIPKGARMIMNEEGDAAFDYLISHSNGIISMRMTLKIKRTYFAPEEYDMLREFFNHVVAKQAEQIVFKKKK